MSMGNALKIGSNPALLLNNWPIDFIHFNWPGGYCQMEELLWSIHGGDSPLRL